MFCLTTRYLSLRSSVRYWKTCCSSKYNPSIRSIDYVKFYRLSTLINGCSLSELSISSKFTSGCIYNVLRKPTWIVSLPLKLLILCAVFISVPITYQFVFFFMVDLKRRGAFTHLSSFRPFHFHLHFTIKLSVFVERFKIDFFCIWHS